MRIRFLQTTASLVPSVPFMPGQEITLPSSKRVFEWLKEGRVEVVTEDEIPEAAVVAAPERTATIKRAKGRHARDTV